MPADFQSAYQTAERAARSRGVRDIEVILASQTEALTRFSNNAIHQNVSEQSRVLSVRVVLDRRTARASTTRFEDDAIERAVEEAIALTRSVQPDETLLPLFTPESCTPVARFDAATASATADLRARTVAQAIDIVESASQIAAGIYSTEQSNEALFNSQGLVLHHRETMARFSVTAMAGDSSGWAKGSACRLGDLDAPSLARSASSKALLSADPRELEPGRYTVILEPAAVLDLVGQMFGDFSGTAVADQRSFLNGRIGQQLFGQNITIHDDVYHPLQSGAPYDGEGVPRRRLTLVENGTPTQLAYSRAGAVKAGVLPTGHGYPLPNEAGESPHNIVIAGGSTPLDQMIASTARGILVTRLWYIREVDPYEKVMTGMTRDGTFLIEDGRLVCGVRNFRFNQSLIGLLCNVESLSPAVRSSGEEAFDLVAPGMKAHEFHFNEVTRF